jgi:hypothetical protein
VEREALIERGVMGRDKSPRMQATRIWHGRCSYRSKQIEQGRQQGRGAGPEKERAMNSVFYIIGVVVVVLVVLSYFGLR